MRGSLLVFLVLSVTASHTKFCRRWILFLSALYYYNSGDFVSSFCFFAGALLADLSLTLRAYAPNPNISDAAPIHYSRLRFRKHILPYWPIALAMFALFLGTMPPESESYRPYSRFIYVFFQTYIVPKDGTKTILNPNLMYCSSSRSSDWRFCRHFPHLFNSIFSRASRVPLPTILCLSWKYFISSLSSPRNIYSNSSSVGSNQFIT
jgi:hypothetical protein